MRFLTCSFIVLLMLTAASFFIFESNSIGSKSKQDLFNASEQDTINLSESYNASEISDIRIDLGSSKLSIVSEKTDKIKVEIKGQSSKKFEVYLKKGTIYIEEKNQLSLFTFNKNNVETILTIPDNYNSSLNVEISSGAILFDTLNAGDVAITLTSGSINGNKLSASNLQVELTSGVVNCGSIDVDDIYVDVTSGSINLREVSGNMQADFTSGSGTFEYSSIPDYIDISLTSGNANIIMPEGAVIALDASSTSGTVKSSVRTDPDADCVVRASTTSGTIKISE